jgi:hypothetical protein
MAHLENNVSTSNIQVASTDTTAYLQVLNIMYGTTTSECGVHGCAVD